MDGWVGGWRVDGWMDGWMDRYIDIDIFFLKYFLCLCIILGPFSERMLVMVT